MKSTHFFRIAAPNPCSGLSGRLQASVNGDIFPDDKNSCGFRHVADSEIVRLLFFENKDIVNRIF